MKKLGQYISRQFLYFILFLFLLFMLNLVVFFLSFRGAIATLNESSPEKMLDTVTSAFTDVGLDEATIQALHKNDIWVIYIDAVGNVIWSYDAPDTLPSHFALQDVANFSRNYLDHYPVFIRTIDTGLIVLGYPANSYFKQPTNYMPLSLIQKLPIYFLITIIVNLGIVFLGYFLSKWRIERTIEPLSSAVQCLAKGKALQLKTEGPLADIAISVNQAATILSKQNEARANWISGVSHDIRTPLSIIIGHAERLKINSSLQTDANAILNQSLVIKDLVSDLNLVSRLEYDMQPLEQTTIYPARLLRDCAVNFLNDHSDALYPLDVKIHPDAQTCSIKGDARLIQRAINNLMNNSLQHNPKGCAIYLSLNVNDSYLMLTVSDKGCGISQESLKNLRTTPHYLNATDDQLNLRHGLGLHLVHKIATAHRGFITIDSALNQGFSVTIYLPLNDQPDAKIKTSIQRPPLLHN